MKVKELCIESSYTFYYKTPNPVPLHEAIDALKGLDKLLKSLPKVTTKLVGLENISVKVEIDHIHSGSLWETLVIKYFFETEEEMHKFIAKARKIMPPKVLIPILATGVIGYGMYLLSKPTPPVTPNINLSNITNSVININGQQIPDSVKKAVIDGVKNKKEIAAATVDFLRPARSQKGSSIEMYTDPDDVNATSFEISKETIKKTPESFKTDPYESQTELEQVIIEIRAIDLDNESKGWEGRIEGVTGRIKIEFGVDVDLENLADTRKFSADVILTSRHIGKSTNPKPVSMEITKIY